MPRHPPPPSLVWLRRDLRLADQPALAAALRVGGPVLPVFIWAPEEEAPWSPGAASRWWLHHALADLDAQLKKQGSRLILRQGPSQETLLQLAKEVGAKHLFFNTGDHLARCSRDEKIAQALTAAGVNMQGLSGAAYLIEPAKFLNQFGKPFQVFSAFWRRYLAEGASVQLQKIPQHKLAERAPKMWPTTVPLESLALLPKISWDKEIYTAWEPTLAGAQRRLRKLVKHTWMDYPRARDVPAEDGTSRLSPYLHFGQISVRQAWLAGKRSPKFLAELGWRDFAHYLLFHFPQLPEQPLRKDFKRFPWQRDARLLRAWQQGQTGYPLVDAGLRQLWQTGWMHNRVRMVCASFLVKHLRQPWTTGERWFWDTLVDADLASNAMGWQWVAGCGADAAPYFRVFNPTLQGERFDPEGNYIRKYVPELAKLSAQFIHSPGRAPAEVLKAANVHLGKNYPRPIVDHVVARRRALQDYQKMRALL